MELLERSKEFRLFLESLTAQDCSEEVFAGEYKAFLLKEGTTTPFTAFVGQRERPTVIISKHVTETSEASSVGLSDSRDLKHQGLELLVDLSISNGTKVVSDDHLPITTHKFVPIGQPLESRRVYLTKSSPFYGGWEGNVIQTSTCARDNGLVPVMLNSARYIASLYSLGVRKAVGGTLPDVWILCERNQQKIIALGCCKSSDLESPLHIFTVEEGKDVDVKNTKTLNGTAFSEYNIANNSFGETMQSGEFRIQFAWNNPDGMLSPPPESADAILSISSLPGDQFSPVLSVYQELQSLYRLCNILEKKGEWPVCEDEEGILESGNKMVDELDIFIQDMASPLPKQTDITVISPTTDRMKIQEPRTNLDFTERLWLFCHDMKRIDEIRLVFAEAFKALLLGKIQPFVHRKSNSVLALLLRQVLLSPNKETALQETATKFQLLLTEGRLLPCLIHIGIEKLQRDYQSFFIGTNICSADQFDRFFIALSSSSSSSSSSSLLSQCLELCKLHSVLELDASIMKMLPLPNTDLLSSFTKAAMEVLRTDPQYQPFEITPTFSFPLPAYSQVLKYVVAMCSKMAPETWCLSSKGDTVYLLRNQPLFGYLQEEPLSEKVYAHKCFCETI